MSSPSRYHKTFSPIRDLQQRYSPSRNLDTILQQSTSSKRSVRDTINQFNYQSKYSVPTPKNTDTYTDTRRLLIENNRLRSDNQVLTGEKVFTNIRLDKELSVRQGQAEALRRQLNLLQDRYERENQALRFQNQSLRKNIVLLQNQKAQQIAILKMRYSTMPQQQRQEIRKSYADDITKTLLDLQTAHTLLNQKQKQLQHLTLLLKKNSQQYGINLQDLISQNNILKNKLLQFQISTQKQIRQMAARKELQKSRTQGIISYCKENTLYIEKQINRLADELLKKNISIQSFNRQITKYQKLIEQSGKRHDNEIHRLKKQYDEIINDKENSFLKLEKQFKLDLAEKKRIQFELIEKISSLENAIQTQQKKLEFANQTIGDKEKIIRELKDSIQRKEQDHAKQISKVMSQSRVKRKSAKNLSSYSSFKDIEEAQGSSIIKSGHIKRHQSIIQDGSHLPIVREQQNLAKSQDFNYGGHQQDQLEFKQLIIHYQSLIQQLKRNKMTQLSIANNKIESLKQNLNQKQQQLLDILNRFSPLMEYKMNREDIDEERRQRIEEHQKGDIDLLDVMLQKYDIVALRKR